MRFLTSLFLLLLTFAAASSQQVSPATDPANLSLQNALMGKWTGVLEYRDYSEPETSTKRVQLPTWLTISRAPEGLIFDYVYDDGPDKTVTSHDTLVVDLQRKSYRVIGTDKTQENYAVTGAEKLKNGRGELILTGEGKDADKPAEIRTTLTIRRNLLSFLEEVRPAKSDAPFVFRHRYTFVREEAPAATVPK